jgi:hypothetical protein
MLGYLVNGKFLDLRSATMLNVGTFFHLIMMGQLAVSSVLKVSIG